MTKGDATTARILEAAGRLMSVRGFAGVSLSDVAEAVGLSKSGVFRHFDGKDALHLAVLQAEERRFLSLAWTPALQMPPGGERLTFIFERWLDWVESEGGPGGCPFLQASVELDDQAGPVRDYLKTIQLRWSERLAGEIALAQPTQPAENRAQAVFDMKSYVLGFAEQRRLLDDAFARDTAKAAFAALLRRLSAAPAD